MRNDTSGSLALLLGVIATACASSTRVAALPPPCVGNDTVYSTAPSDTARHFVAATATRIVLPPQGFTGTAIVSLLVDARGRVIADSTHVEGGSGASALRRASAGYRFLPATLNSCAVSSWYQLRVQR